MLTTKRSPCGPRVVGNRAVFARAVLRSQIRARAKFCFAHWARRQPPTADRHYESTRPRGGVTAPLGDALKASLVCRPAACYTWAAVDELRSSRGASFPCFQAARRAASDCMLLMRMRLRSDSVQRARETARSKVRVGVVPSKAPPPREREKFCVLLQQARLTSKSHPMASCATRTATCARLRGRTNRSDHRPLGPSGLRAKALEPSHPLISTFGVY